MYSSTLSLNSGVDGQCHSLAAVPWARPGTHCIGGWVGPRAGIERVQKISPAPGFVPQTVQHIMSLYAD
jgi:hypothetical protein